MRIAQRGRLAEDAGAPAVEGEGVVVAPEVADAVEVGADAGAERAERAEILRRAGHVEAAARGDLAFVHFEYLRGVEPQFVVEHVARRLAREVEVDVVREVHDRRAVGACEVGDLQWIVVVEIEYGLHGERARIALVAIFREERHDHAVRLHASLPHAVGEALRAAVEVVASVVGLQPVLRAFDLHASAGDAVGAAAHAFARSRGVAEIPLRAAVAQHHVVQTAVAVGHARRHDRGAVGAQRDFGTRGVAHRVAHDGLAFGRHAPDVLLDLHYSAGCRFANRRSMRRSVSSRPMKAVTSYMPGPLPAPTSARRSVFITCPVP